MTVNNGWENHTCLFTRFANIIRNIGGKWATVIFQDTKILILVEFLNRVITESLLTSIIGLQFMDLVLPKVATPFL